MRHIHHNRNLVRGLIAIVALGCFMTVPRWLRAQNSLAGWAEKKYPDDGKRELVPATVKVRADVNKILRTGKFDTADEEQSFTDYYEKSLFPNIKAYDPPNRDSKDDVVAKLRNDLRNLERPSVDRQGYDKLAELILYYMPKTAQNDKCHPAARVNAMLAVGEVNSSSAAKALLDAAFKEGHIFPVRIAAMAGLIRMAASPNGKQVLTDSVMEPDRLSRIIKIVEFRAATRNDGIFWIRGQIADMLAGLGQVGPKGEVPRALLTMLKDKDLPVPLRCKAARALGQLEYGGNAPADGQAYLTALAEFARDATASDQPANQGRVRQVAHDVDDAVKKLSASAKDPAWGDSLDKTLLKLFKDTEPPLKADELKKVIEGANKALDGLLNGNR